MQCNFNLGTNETTKPCYKVFDGVDKFYESSLSHILMLKPMTCIEDVFNMITQDERQKSIKPPTALVSVVFQTTGPAHSNFQKDEKDNAALDAYYHNKYSRKQRPLCT